MSRSYGTVRLGGAWVVDCVAHVRIRFKRVFERVAKVGPTITLSDTPENGRELLWFLDRFPMDMLPGHRRHLTARAAEYDAAQLRIQEVLGADFTARRFALALPAREYQAVAAELALRSGGLLDADDVGLGKTATALAMLMEPDTRPALVVTLAHLQRQWAAECAKFAPGLTVHTLKRLKPYPLEPVPDVILTSYAKVAKWSDALAGHVRSVVFDECQELRRSDSDKYTGARYIASEAQYRLGLSATPIYNYGSEIFNVLDCLQPGALGSRQEFGREWCARGDWGDGAKIEDPRAFGHYLRERGLMLRRTRAEVGRELPAVSHVVQEIDADTQALEQVEEAAADLARTVLMAGEAYRGQKLRASEELSMVLRQATGIAKAPHVAAFVRLLVSSGERVVLYGWHHAVYALWRELLKDRAKAAFLSGAAKVLVISLRAGAGLDGLQAACRTVVFGELDWAPGVHEQCVGRIHRDGQKDPVMAYFLLADSGSDPVVADVLGLKRQQSEAIRDPGAELVEKLQVDPDHIKRLASAYLAQRGIAVDTPGQPL